MYFPVMKENRSGPKKRGFTSFKQNKKKFYFEFKLHFQHCIIVKRTEKKYNRSKNSHS